MIQTLASRAAVGLFLFALATLPFIANSYQTRLATSALIYGIGAIGLNLLIGYGGMISFGHAAFFGIGAYAAAILGPAAFNSAIIILPCATAASAIGALLIGAMSLRMTGAYFIMITLAFAQMLFYGSIAITKLGGDEGIAMPRKLSPRIRYARSARHSISWSSRSHSQRFMRRAGLLNRASGASCARSKTMSGAQLPLATTLMHIS